MRWKDKHPTPEKKLEDLKKARHFLDKYIEDYEAWLPGDLFRKEDTDFVIEESVKGTPTIFRCMHCGARVRTDNLEAAYKAHGACPQPHGYVHQG